MLCVAVGSWCCKITVLCNMRGFPFCLMERQHIAPFNESTFVVAIVMEQDINRSGTQSSCSACVQLPLTWSGFYRWVENSAQPLAFNFLQVSAHYLHARKMGEDNSSLLPKSRSGFPCSASPSLVPGFPVTRLRNTQQVTCPNSTLQVLEWLCEWK